MTVAWILRDKGRRVVSLLPRTSLNEAIGLLAHNKIGALVVVDEQNRVLGIISERDIVRILATKGARVLDEAVSDHMTRPVVTCGEHHSIDWLMGEMTASPKTNAAARFLRDFRMLGAGPRFGASVLAEPAALVIVTKRTVASV